MSFILKNKQLIDLLTSIGAEDISKFAQPTPGTEGAAGIGAGAAAAIPGLNLTYPEAIVAQKLLQNLQNTLPSTNPLDNIGTENSDAPKAGINIDYSIRNLGDYVKWIANNQLTWQGKQIAWKDEKASQPQYTLTFSTYMDSRYRDENRKLNEDKIYASKEPLIAFTIALRDSKENKSNKGLQVLLASLIQQLNNKLPGDDRIDHKPAAVNPEMVVDGLSSDTLHPSNNNFGLNDAPKFENAAFKIKYKDIQNEGAFLRLLDGMKVTVVGPNNTEKPVPAHRQGQDNCYVFQVLYVRAKWLSDNSVKYDNPEYVTAAKQYLKIITEVGQKQQDANGAACNVAGLAGGVSPGAGTGSGTGTTDGGPSVKDKQDSIISIFKPENLPFADYTQLSLITVSRFLKSVQSANLNPNTTTMATQCEQLLTQISTLSSSHVFNVSGYDLFKHQVNNTIQVIPIVNSLLIPLVTKTIQIMHTILGLFPQLSAIDRTLTPTLHEQDSFATGLQRNLAAIADYAGKNPPGSKR